MNKKISDLTQTIRFSKMQGIGNDYIYINTIPANHHEQEDTRWQDSKYVGRLAQKLSDRHFGIGADGLVLIRPSARADYFMDMYNSDGSRGQMCGNAIRCVGKYVYDRRFTDSNKLSIETLSGIRLLELFTDGGSVYSVAVDMGEPVLDTDLIPVVSDRQNMIDQQLKIDGKIWQLTAVSMGNPHAVTFLPEVETLDLTAIGPLFEHHSIFPERVNTEFVQIIDRTRLRMRVWERGSGETMACGTGSCASLVAGVLTGRCEREAELLLNGGSLQIEWRASDNHVIMTGPAAFVFEGITELEGYYAENQ